MNKVPEILGSGESCLLSCSQPLPCYVLLWPFLSAHGEGKKVSSVSLTLVLLGHGLTFMTSFNLNYFHRGPSLNIATLGVRTLLYESGGRGTNI